MPQLDSTVAVAAAVKDFAGDENLTLDLVRVTSLAEMCRNIAMGTVEAAVLPAPFPLAANLGLVEGLPRLSVPMTLSLGGFAVTIGARLRAASERTALRGPGVAMAGGSDLRVALRRAREAQGMPPRLAVGQMFSTEHWLLRYWLSACSIDPDRDIAIVAMPPPAMPLALAEGVVDAFCAGEPWNSLALDAKTGRILVTGAGMWRAAAASVLAVTPALEQETELGLDPLLRALYHASQWCAHSENIEELAGIMAAGAHLGVEGRLLLPALTGSFDDPAHGTPWHIEDFLVLGRKGATFPWQSHALWFYSQMVRWGHSSFSQEQAGIARDSFRPDLYRHALKPLFAPVPGANLKLEGALQRPSAVGASNSGLILGPDPFCDGRIFDPDCIESYVKSLGA